MKVLELAYILGVSERTIYRAMKKAKIEKIQSEDDIFEILKNISDVKIIYDTTGEIVVIRKDGRVLKFQDIRRNLTTLSDSQTTMSKKIEDILIEQNRILLSFLEKQEAILQNLALQTKSLVEIAQKIVSSQKSLPQEILKRKKDIELAIQDYIYQNNLYYSNPNDIFIELLEKFEKETKQQIRAKYEKEDRTYMNTIIRLGLDADFIEFVRKKI